MFGISTILPKNALIIESKGGNALSYDGAKILEIVDEVALDRRNLYHICFYGICCSNIR